MFFLNKNKIYDYVIILHFVWVGISNNAEIDASINFFQYFVDIHNSDFSRISLINRFSVHYILLF